MSNKIVLKPKSNEDTKNLLIACTGSVATIKLPLLIESLSNIGNTNIVVVATERAKHFIDQHQLPAETTLYSDEDEWSSWTVRGDPVLHIELAKWADLMVIAPLDANTLAKMANGLCDNLLTCITRAWIMDKPLLFCPAMNTRMWEHPVTSQHVKTLIEWGHIQVPCITKTLMCGDTGAGAMAEVATIVDCIKVHLNKR